MAQMKSAHREPGCRASILLPTVKKRPRARGEKARRAIQAEEKIDQGQGFSA
jgi:hypothetical protein